MKLEKRYIIFITLSILMSLNVLIALPVLSWLDIDYIANEYLYNRIIAIGSTIAAVLGLLLIINITVIAVKEFRD